MLGCIFIEIEMIDTGIKQSRLTIELQNEGSVAAGAGLRTMVSIVPDLTSPAGRQ
jgi:hypothetical protein